MPDHTSPPVAPHSPHNSTRSILTVVRHGETSANIDGVWHGSTDTPLTDRGHAQAERVANYVGKTWSDVSAIYASPLERAQNTASAIGRVVGLERRTEPDLQEFDLGEWEGLTFDVLMRDKQLWHHMKRDPDFAPHGGESPSGAAGRLAAALRRIAEAHPGERVVVVSHGGALGLAFGLILDGDYTQWNRMMSNCAVSELAFGPTPELLSFNYTDHLEGV